MMTGLSLVAEVNHFLDSVSPPKNDDEINEMLAKLKKYKEEMERAGFKTPYKGTLVFPKNVYSENDRMQLKEISKQIKLIRYIGRLKKATLDRARMSIVSYNIASSLSNKQKTEFYKYLPFDGNYIKILSKGGIEANVAFQRLTEILSQHNSEKWITATVEYYEDGIKKETTVRLKSRSIGSIKEIYGDDAKIVKTKIIKKRGIISNSVSRVIVAIMFSAWAADKAKIKTKNILKNDDDIKTYNKILRSYGLVNDILIENVEGFDRVKQLLRKKGFLETGDDGKEYVVQPLRTKILSRRRRINNLTERLARAELLRTIYGFYIKNSERHRSVFNIYPGLSVCPDNNVTGMFDEMINTHGISSASLILQQKFEFEKKVPKGFDDMWGVGFFAKKTGKSIEWCSKFFDIDKENVKEAVRNINILINNRGEKFINILKGK